MALRLAELVLGGVSVEAGPGGTLSNAFLLDMWQVYEDFLSTSLRTAIEGRYGGAVHRQGKHHLDQGGRLELRPDILWRSPAGRYAAVVDAKYKTDEAREDVYQMLAYCLAYGVTRGHLVYVSWEKPLRRHRVRNTDVEIVCHALDLGLPPAELLARIGALADDVTVTAVP